MSIIEIAKRAGVSIATVSRVINEQPYVSTEATQAVNDAIATLNYQPRKSGPRKVRAKRNSKSNSRRKLAALALVMPEVRAGFMPSLISSFDAAAGEFAHQVVTCNTDNSSAKQADVIVQLIQNRVAGVALMPTTLGPPTAHQIHHLQSAGIPVVLLHREIEGAQAPLIDLCYEEVGRRAAEAIVAAGHRRIGLFFAHESPVTRRYEQGVRQALTQRGLILQDQFIHFGSSGLGGGLDPEHEPALDAALSKMMAVPRNQRPTALFAPWEDDAELLYILSIGRGLKLPADLSLMTVGSSWRGSAISRRLSAITIDEVQVGRIAATLLIDMANSGKTNTPQQRHVIPMDCYAGQTLGPPPGG